MFLVSAWFATDQSAERSVRAGIRRADSSIATLLADTYTRRDIGGADWGLTVCHLDRGPFRWPTLDEDADVTAVSLGIPVGSGAAGGPLGMARRLLGGDDVHADIVPPFGLIACERTRAHDGQMPPTDGRDAAHAYARVVLQQDWLGHCRLFTATAGGVTGFSNRPSLLATFLTGEPKPSTEGWAAYTATGHFGGSTSPIEDVRLLDPGERVTCRRAGSGSWSVTSDNRYSADDIVRAGLSDRAGGPETALDRAAAAFTQTIASLADLYDDDIRLGLSGGKDSRVIAAAFLAAGRMPALLTNDDTPAEADTARHLVEIIGRTRGIHPVHDIRPAGAPADVLGIGLLERTVRLQRQFDFQKASSYLVRPAPTARLQVAIGSVSVTGAAGELATGYWYPRTPADSPEAIKNATYHHLLAAVAPGAARPDVIASQRDRVTGIIEHAASLGLAGEEVIDYVYLMERMRRWSTSAYAVGLVVPFLTPQVVAATFALTAAEKRDRLLHTGLLSRLAPEWVDVPYVSVNTGPSTAAAIWDGDGLRVVRNLFYGTATEGIVGLMCADAVHTALADCEAGRARGPHKQTLQQFVALAVASRWLEPATARSALHASIHRIRLEGLIPRQREPRAAGAERRVRAGGRTPVKRFARRAVRKVLPRRPNAG
jgi:hypothetical protein